MVSKTQDSEGSSSKSHTSPPTSDTKECPNKNENQTSSSSHLMHQNTTDSTACLITPSNIHINHMYIYNFTPDLVGEAPSFSPHSKVPSKYQSPAASSGPICRICHEGDDKEDLVSPCRCAGTVGLVHKSCMEKWLSSRSSTYDKCEICHYKFATIRSPKSVLEWIRSDENRDMERRGLMGDVTCFILLTPLALISSFLCIEGTKRQVLLGNSLEAGCLMASATFLVTIYFIWNVFTLRYHFRSYLKWRAKNYNVKLVRVQRVSAGGKSEESHCVQVISQVSRPNSSPQIVIPMPESPEGRVAINISASI